MVTNPEEAAYAKAESDFNTAKAAALDALNNGFKTYDQAQYSDTGWASSEQHLQQGQGSPERRQPYPLWRAGGQVCRRDHRLRSGGRSTN